MHQIIKADRKAFSFEKTTLAGRFYCADVENSLPFIYFRRSICTWLGKTCLLPKTKCGFELLVYSVSAYKRRCSGKISFLITLKKHGYIAEGKVLLLSATVYFICSEC